jgi:hypothetical protein
VSGKRLEQSLFELFVILEQRGPEQVPNSDSAATED